MHRIARGERDPGAGFLAKYPVSAIARSMLARRVHSSAIDWKFELQFVQQLQQL
jgi:hypothetical protein